MPTVADIIQQAAARYGLPPEYLLRTAQIESGMNPAAANPNSSARGLFQFTRGTAQQYGLSNPFDPVASTDAAARLAIDNMAHFKSAMGRDPSPAEMYLMHQQGAGGATRLLGNPNAPAASIVGSDAVRLNAGNPSMTAGQFASLWLNKFGNQTGQPVPGAPSAGNSTGVQPTGPAPVAAPGPQMAAQQPGLGALLAMPLLQMASQQAPEPEQKPKKQKSDSLARILMDASPNLVLA